MVTAIDPDRCWKMASLFRKTSVPSNVLTCETSFLVGSVVRDIIRTIIPEVKQQQALMSAEAAYFKTFDDQSEDDLPSEMREIYGDDRLGHVARIALAAYGEHNDTLFSTAPIFVRRIKGDPRMTYEITPLLKEQKALLSKVFTELAKVSVKDINVRLLHPAVHHPLKDSVEIERRHGAMNSNNHQQTGSAHPTDSTTRRKNVDYFAKVSNFLAANRLRGEFTTLQGGDKDYGEATARICAIAELANEPPIVIATFLMESMDHYHKNRDIALSYLARLESGLRGKVENPELAAEIDSETRAEEMSYELFASINMNSGSPEARYIREVNSFIQEVDHFDDMVFPAQKDKAFMAASANVYLAGYQTNSSPKVVGALIADGAHKYKTNPQLGIFFLNKVAKDIRTRHDEALSAVAGEDKGADRKDNGHTVYQSAQQTPKVISSGYHDFLDEIADSAMSFLATIALHDRADSAHQTARLYAELLLYLSASKARKDTRVEIHPMIWNTFKRGIEVRMLGIRDENRPRSAVISTPDGGQAFAHFTSTYWDKMDELETVLNERGVTSLTVHLLNEMGSDASKAREFNEFFFKLCDESSAVLVPKIADLG